MKHLMLLLAVFIYTFSVGQNNYSKEIRLAETAFALESQIKGLKQGFLNNLDTSAIGINRTGFTNLYNIWDKRSNNNNTVLLWEPKSIFASSDGLFGITNGPYYTLDSATSSLKNTGYFFTIWERQSFSNAYKILIDAGVPLDPPISKDSASALPVKELTIQTKNKKYSAITNYAFLTGFNSLSSSESLYKALEKFTLPKSDVLLSRTGRLKTNELIDKDLFHNRCHFMKVGSRSLGNGNGFFEYGSFKEDDTSKGETVTGYFVHVWMMKEDKLILIVALYKLS